MKRTIKLTGRELKQMISESVKRVLRESTRPRRRFGLRESNSITAQLDAMYENGDYSKLYADPRLWKEDVWFSGNVSYASKYEGDYFAPEAANYIIEDYLKSHDLNDIELMGGDGYDGGSTGEDAAEIIVRFLLGKNGDEIEKQLESWSFTDQL